MRTGSNLARMTVAALSALALTATASPALAGGPVTLVNGEEITQGAGGKDTYKYGDQGLLVWSVTGVRPDQGAEADLTVYADQANEFRLARSKKPGGAVDFVAVDLASTPATTHYPTVRSSGAASYTVELDRDVQTLGAAPVTFTMTNDDVIHAINTDLDPGVTYKFKLTPGDGDQDGGLYLLESNPNNSETTYQARKEALASADKKGAGGTETITIVGGISDRIYGLVLTNVSGSGTYTLTRTIV